MIYIHSITLAWIFLIAGCPDAARLCAAAAIACAIFEECQCNRELGEQPRRTEPLTTITDAGRRAI